MTLAVMLSTDKDMFFCDMWETYQVKDYKALPVETLAVLASGLREDSRIRMKMSGMAYVPLELLAAKCTDSLAYILHVLSADNHMTPPKRVMDYIIHPTEKPRETAGFRSGTDFEAARRKLIGADDNGE